MMNRIRVAVLLVWTCGVVGSGWVPLAPVVGSTLFAQQPAPVEEFVPIDQLPPQDQLPAAPLLVAAYALVVLVLFAYVVSLARRITAVHRDLDRLDADLKKNARR